MLAVTHDRYFLDNVAEWICEVDRGHLYPYKGNYSTYLETKAARLEAQGQQEAKLAKKLERELEWVRSSPKARQAKSEARLERYEQMDAESALHGEGRTSPTSTSPPGPRLGDQVLVADHLSKSFGDRVLIDDLSFELPAQRRRRRHRSRRRGRRRRFFKCVAAGLEEPSAGTLDIERDGQDRLRRPENRAGIDPDKSTWEVGVGWPRYHRRGGGDRGAQPRLRGPALVSRARIRAKPARRALGWRAQPPSISHLRLSRAATCSCSTKPTNDLDTETLASLEEALLAFSGFLRWSSRATTAGSSTGLPTPYRSLGRVRRGTPGASVLVRGQL